MGVYFIVLKHKEISEKNSFFQELRRTPRVFHVSQYLLGLNIFGLGLRTLQEFIVTEIRLLVHIRDTCCFLAAEASLSFIHYEDKWLL